MTDTARNIEHSDPASTDGMADLFDISGTTSQAEIETCPESVSGPSQPFVRTVSLVTAAQAAKFLGINKRSVIRLISENKLTAVKENGKYLISQTALQLRKDSLCRQDVIEAEVSGPSCTVEVDVSGPSQSETVSLEIHDPVSETQFFQEKILKDLESATYRLGYLEAQLAERNSIIEQQQKQILLLTDSQHKATWWDRFRQLFVKQ